MYVLAQLNTQGNGIAIAGTHEGENIGFDLQPATDDILGMTTTGTPFKADYTFTKSN